MKSSQLKKKMPTLNLFKNLKIVCRIWYIQKADSLDYQLFSILLQNLTVISIKVQRNYRTDYL